MKNIFKFSFLISFIFLVCFAFDVDASSYFRTYLECQSSANTNESLTCDILATTDIDTTIDRVTFSNLNNLKVVKKTLDTSINRADGKISVGTVTVKIGTGNSDATISANVIPNAGSLQTKSSSAQVINVVSSINTLKTLKLDGAIVNGFSKDVTSYNIDTKNKTVNLSASATSSTATVTGTGLKNLSCGSNQYKIVVKAETGSKRTYTLNVNRQCDNKVYLSGITVSSGSLSPSFDKKVTSYVLNVDSKVKKVSITGQKGDASQKITGNVKDYEIKDGDNKINITVSNSSGEKVVYTVNVVRGNGQDSNTYLSSLALSSGNITFNKNTFEYETKVLYNVRNIEVLATPEKSTSKYVVTGGDGLVVGENIVKITVTAQSGDTKDYIVKVTRLKEGESFGDNANIKNIIVKGYEKNFKFEYNRLSYNLVIKDEDSLDISVVMDDANSTYRIIGNSNLKDGSMVKIETTSLDGTSKIYTINITKKSSLPYVILFILLIAGAIGIVLFAYFKYVRKKKELLDVNGYRINGNQNDEGSYRKTMVVPQNSLTKNAASRNNLGNVLDDKKDNKSGDKPATIKVDDAQVKDIAPESSNKCSKCGRELLGNPEVCPYCNNKLR